MGRFDKWQLKLLSLCDSSNATKTGMRRGSEKKTLLGKRVTCFRKIGLSTQMADILTPTPVLLLLSVHPTEAHPYIHQKTRNNKVHRSIIRGGTLTETAHPSCK